MLFAKNAALKPKQEMEEIFLRAEDSIESSVPQTVNQVASELLNQVISKT